MILKMCFRVYESNGYIVFFAYKKLLFFSSLSYLLWLRLLHLICCEFLNCLIPILLWKIIFVSLKLGWLAKFERFGVKDISRDALHKLSLEPRIYRKHPLYPYKVRGQAAYSLSSPDLTCATRDMLSLYINCQKYLADSIVRIDYWWKEFKDDYNCCFGEICFGNCCQLRLCTGKFWYHRDVDRSCFTVSWGS